MYMAAQVPDAREFEDRSLTEPGLLGQSSQQQQHSLRTLHPTSQYGQQNFGLSDQAAAPVSPTTPPTRTQDVRVQCEAPDCQALLQVSIPLTQPIRQAVIVRCGGCSRLLEVELAAALEHLDSQRQDQRGFPPQAEAASANQPPSYQTQPQYSHTPHQTHPYIPPPSPQQTHNLSSEALTKSPSLQTHPYAPIPPVYQPPARGYSQAPHVDQAWRPPATDLQTHSQSFPETPRSISASPVYHHVTPVPLLTHHPVQALAPPTDLQTPQISYESFQPARSDAYSGPEHHSFDQHGNPYVTHRQQTPLPNPFSVHNPNPYAATPPTQHIMYQPTATHYLQTHSHSAPQYAHPSQNALLYPPAQYAEPAPSFPNMKRPHPQASHAPYYIQQHQQPSSHHQPSLQYTAHAQPPIPHQYLQQGQQYHHDQPAAQHPQPNSMEAPHAGLLPMSGLDPANTSSSSMGHDVEGASSRKRRKDRPPKEPTPYNIFVREEIARLKEANPDMSHKDAFAAAASNWQYAPNNNGRAKKSRLKKEAAAAARPQFFKPQSQPSDPQQHPAQVISIPLHAGRDRPLLNRAVVKVGAVSVDPKQSLPDRQSEDAAALQQTTEQSQDASGIHSEDASTVQHVAQPNASGQGRQQSDTDAQQASVEHGQAALITQSVHKGTLQQQTEPEAIAVAASRAPRQDSPACTEHRHMLYQALVDPLNSGVTSNGVHDTGTASQHPPIAAMVCESGAPDRKATLSAKDAVPESTHQSLQETPAQPAGHVHSNSNSPVADALHNPPAPSSASSTAPAGCTQMVPLEHKTEEASHQLVPVQDCTARPRSTTSDLKVAEAARNRSPEPQSTSVAVSECIAAERRSSPARPLASGSPHRSPMASLVGATNSNVSLAAEHAVLESAQPELEQCDKSTLHQQTLAHTAEAPAKAVLQQNSPEDVIASSLVASDRCITADQGYALCNTQAWHAEHMPDNKSSVEAVSQASLSVGQAENARRVHTHLVDNAEMPPQADVDGIVMPPQADVDDIAMPPPPSRDSVSS